ncbi:uncharacterized protein LOC110687665 [Chenopodium quinoa]|uniref:uncharacterized protein LOC110687665 n=1 Tax=Chenopodium quinoa TaxID=63459 RepID=UPI000B76F329|nr:uncharacterized protein LOC110687665 [Chenopodium quinoa]
MGKFKYETPALVQRIGTWVRNRTMKEKLCMGAIAAVVMLVLLKVLVKDHAHFFVAAQTSHAVGILLLIYKLTISKTCSDYSNINGLCEIALVSAKILMSITKDSRAYSYKSICETPIQPFNPRANTCCTRFPEPCSYFVGDVYDAVQVEINLPARTRQYAPALRVPKTNHGMSKYHTMQYVLYIIIFEKPFRFSHLKTASYMSSCSTLAPCAVAALLAHPTGPFPLLIRWMWSFCISVEAVAVLPQLRLMQNAKMVEPFTSHYVFALGVSRFMGCANWIIQLIETRGVHLMLIGQGHIWILLALVAELVHTFILADFCYYYVKGVMEGQTIMSLRSLV